MKVLHASAECYPIAKVGGMGDVVGSLPRYLNQEGAEAAVVMPKYDNDWINNHSFEEVWSGSAPLGSDMFGFTVEQGSSDELGFPLYVIDIPGRFDRPAVYVNPNTGEGYHDEFERFLSFQIAILDWIQHSDQMNPDILHCHDHHTGLIPFMMSEAFRYESLREMPSVLTIHNAEYQGIHPLTKHWLMPEFDLNHMGLIDWDGYINNLAAGIKSAWRVTTVSKTYMEEMRRESNGLERLIDDEWQKCTGILNGIDADTWDPDTDEMIAHNFSPKNRKRGKRQNKEALCKEFDLDPDRPLISYIGRLAREKGADLLPDLIASLFRRDREVNFMVLGKGDWDIHEKLDAMNSKYMGYFDARLEYNERLAHQIYAGSDFIFMPSRVEPCGLNQMYAMRYGALPIVRAVGGLQDSVKDLNESKGYGFKFDEFSIESSLHAIGRGLDLYDQERKRSRIIGHVMRLDFSWNASAKEYIKMYTGIINQ